MRHWDICETIKNSIKVILLYVKFTSLSSFKLDFQEVDQHTGGKWLIPGTERRTDNQLRSLEPPVEYPRRECKQDIKEFENDMFNPIFKENVHRLGMISEMCNHGGILCKFLAYKHLGGFEGCWIQIGCMPSWQMAINASKSRNPRWPPPRG